MNPPARPNLLDFDRPSLAAFLRQRGEQPYRADQVVQWVYQRGEDDFGAMTNLSRVLRGQLADWLEIRLPEVVADTPSRDGSRKWLLRLADGNCIESVFIPEQDRATLCLSSQVGCALNCDFCATGYQGFNRNLDTGEIVGQLLLAWRALQRPGQGRRPITNVVMMGMGEPLANFDNVVRAMRLMQDDLAFGLSRRRITLSTAGMVPAMDRLKQACDVSLAVSLHAPTDALRDRLVPLNRKYPIAELMAACRRYVAGEARRRITFEYVMLDGVNDSEAQARQLVALLRPVPAKVNLIPFNPFPGSGYRTSPRVRIDRFREILLGAGILTVTRKTRGDDIDAACGQLAGRFRDRTRRRLALEAAAR